MKTYSLETASKLLNTTINDLKEIYSYKSVQPIYDELISVGITNVEIVVSIDQYDNAYHIDNFYIQYLTDSVSEPYYINKWNKYGYSVVCYVNYANLTNDRKRNLINGAGLAGTKKVNKPTIKKIAELFENEANRHVLFIKANDENNNKKSIFLKSIELFIENNKSKLTRCTQTKDLTTGWFDTDKFVYSYQIHTDGYIEEKIKYTGQVSLLNFEKLL